MDEAWERAVEAACGGVEYKAVRSLTLDGAVKCSQGRLPPPALLQQFSQLRVLSIANVGLSSLTDFPSLPQLECLVLSDNRISGSLESLVEAGLVSLRDLDLSNNKIQALEELVPLAKLNLLSLDLYKCPVTRVQDYRTKVFSFIKSLQYLDKFDADNIERPESDDEEEDDDADEDVDDVEDFGPVGLPKPGARNTRINASVEDEDDDEEESDEIDEEDERVHYNGVANHLPQGGDDSGSEDEEDEEDDDDNEGDGVAVEVHDIEETEEDEDDDEGVGEEDEDDDDDDEGTELAQSLEGEIDAQDENGELGDEDVVIENEGEEDDVGYYESGYIQVEDEGASDLEPGDDDEDDDDDEEDDDNDVQDIGPPPAAPSSKRKRSKDDSSDESEDERSPKH